MAKLQRTLQLDDTERQTVAGWDVAAFGKAVSKLVTDQIKTAARARDALAKGGPVGPDDIEAVRAGLATVKFWADAVPQGELPDAMADQQEQAADVDRLLASLESLLAGN